MLHTYVLGHGSCLGCRHTTCTMLIKKSHTVMCILGAHNGMKTIKIKIFFIQRGDPLTKCESWSHVNPPWYFECWTQLLKPNGKCNKIGWDSFFHLSLGLNSLPGNCVCLLNMSTTAQKTLLRLAGPGPGAPNLV